MDAVILSIPLCDEDVEVTERELLPLAVIFMSLLTVSQRSTDVWV